MRRPSGAAITCTLILTHIAWGLVRIPGKVIARRHDDVRSYRKAGAATFLLDASGLRGVRAIEWLHKNTPVDSVVLWSGEGMKAMEFADPLLSPRLIVHASAAQAGQTHYAKLPIAQYEQGDHSGNAVLVGGADGLHLETQK